MSRNFRGILFAFGLLAFFAHGSNASAAEKLVQSTDLTYLGAFRVPSGNFGCSDPAKCSFTFGGSAISYNPANNSLFMAGNIASGSNKSIAEIKIPAIVNSTNLSSLNTATVLQNFADLSQGNIANLGPGGAAIGNGGLVGGTLVNGSKLVVSAYAFYDASSAAVMTHFTANANWIANGIGYSGMKTVAVPPAPQAGFVAGYMGRIPDNSAQGGTNWQTALGGTALTGKACLSIINRTSMGPSAFAFEPNQIGSVNPVPANPLVYYPMAHQTLGTYDSPTVANTAINMASEIYGIVFPAGSRSVLFFGRNGLGKTCYGQGTNNQSLNGTATGDGDYYCYDPAENNQKGTHAYPYAQTVWAYDANDLLAVKNGTKNPWDVLPYAQWTYTLPFQQGTARILGAAYDPATQRIYVSQENGDTDGTYYDVPVVHAFQVNLTAPAPDTTAPTVSLTNPANNATVSGTVSLTANATDDVGVSKVEFYVNGSLQATDTSTPYLYSWDTSSLAAGSYTLMAKAYDSAGNVGQSSTVTVTIVKDTTPPVASLTSPINNASISGTTTITANASDNVGVAKVEFYENGTLLAATNVSPYSYSWNTMSVPNGSYTLNAKAYDASGNIGQSTNVSVTVNNSSADTSAPTITAFTVPATSTSLTVPITVITATDNIAVTGYQLTESSTSPAATSTGWTSSAPASYTFASAGSKTLYAWAKDAAGNVSSGRSATTTISLATATAAATADPNATAKTQALFAYLKNLPTGSTNRILSGQESEGKTDSAAGVFSATGKYPAIVGRDYTLDLAYYNISQINNYLLTYANNGSLITASDHFRNFQSGGDAWDTTNVDFVQLVTPGTSLNTKLNTELDRIAVPLAALQSNDTPVLFRMLHEMNGTWFWWGAKDTTQYKNLWKYIFNYMTNTKGLHNLLWVWAPNNGIDWSYYPGDAYVDIVGSDIYGQGENLSTTSGYDQLSSHGKPFAITEYGACAGNSTASTCSPQDISTMVNSLKTSMPKTSYWLSWAWWWSMPSSTGVSQLLADPWVVTRDELPANLTTGGSDTTAPSVPTNISASAVSSSQINLSWTASTDNVGVSGYRISRNGAQVGTSTSNSYQDTGLSANTSYTYTVAAYDAANNVSAQSTSVSATTLQVSDTSAPTVPANLSATAISSNQINLTWTASTDNTGVTGYDIFRNGTLAGTSSSNSYQDTGLAANTSYTYTVAAYDAAGNVSAQSSGANATTTAAIGTGGTMYNGYAGNAPTLPITGTRIINVSTEPQLQSAMANLQAGDTIVLADGTYNLTNSLYINGKDNVTIRGNSGMDNVVLVGKGMDNASYGNVPYGIWSNSVNTTVANLTINNTYDDEIIFNAGAQSPHVYNVKLLNSGSQFVKANPTDATNGIGVNNGIVEYCWFEYTNGPPVTDHGSGVGYFNGISAHAADNWIIRKNLFKNLHNPDSSTNYWWNPAVLMWNHSTGTITEDNVFINVDRAVAYGLVNQTTGTDHSGGIIRNNFVYLAPGLMTSTRTASSDGSIIVWDSPATAVDHNTVITNGNVSESIEFRFAATTGAEVKNNLTDKAINTSRDSAAVTSSGNYTSATSGMFASMSTADLHILSNASTLANVIGKVPVLASVSADFDGDNRTSGTKTDIGADSLASTSNSTAPTTAPAAVSPTGANILINAPFTFNALPGATNYQIWLQDMTTNTGAPTTFTASQAGCAAGTGTCSYIMAAPLVAGHSYGWVVAAQNAIGQGPWSSALSFTVGGTPAAPAIATPANNGITTTPSFTLNAVSGATNYVIWLQDMTTNSGTPYQFTAAQGGCASGTGTCSFALGTSLVSGHDYSWVAAAQNGTAQGPWSSALFFHVGTLTAPTITAPTGTGIASPPVFTVKAVTGATYYQIWLQNNSTNSGSSIIFTAAQGGTGCTGTGTCKFTGPALVSGNSYSWVAAGQTAAVQGPWSAPLSFIAQ